MTCSLIPQFSSEDVVAVRVKNVRREGDSFVFVSAYMALEEPAPPVILKELLSFSDRDKIPTVKGTDANAHHNKPIPSTNYTIKVKLTKLVTTGIMKK